MSAALGNVNMANLDTHVENVLLYIINMSNENRNTYIVEQVYANMVNFYMNAMNVLSLR